jgi:glycosyltransferase involved in cell wall biosynthesis
MKLTVLIPTHNPRPDYLSRTLDALRAQNLPTADWELLLIDNCSTPPISASLVAWHPHGRVVPAPVLGLTHARVAGTEAASGYILVWVDDDNLLASDYLSIVLHIFSENERLGAAGGKSIPQYDSPPPAWYSPDLAPLGCRDLGDTFQDARWEPGQARSYPAAAPIGAGLAIRREALLHWVSLIKTDPVRQSFGRTGSALTSGEDNDINLTLLAAGWSLAYEPALRLTHLIPPRRLTLDYQCRIARASFRDFVRVLALHGIRPWPAISRAGIRARQLKAWFTRRAWRRPADRIRWQGDCGQIEGRASIKST